MGLEYSVFETLGHVATDETTTTERDGKVTVKKKNPWVSGVIAVSVTGILLVYLDGGKGTISKCFGKVCVECSKPITHST